MGLSNIFARPSRSTSNPSRLAGAKRPSRFLLVLGIVLLVLDSCAIFMWLYFLQPLRHEGSAEWRATHTDEELWSEIQKRVHRLEWMHDDVGNVGMRGDKQWTEWVVHRIKPDEDLRSCAIGHKDHALRYMTNQDAGHMGGDWIAWWEKNKSKTQEQWIRDGFVANGLKLNNPLDESDIWRLLAAIAEADKDTYRFNAARLIMASDLLMGLDFNRIPPESQASVFTGLRDYNIICQNYLFANSKVNCDLKLRPPLADSYLDYWIAKPRVAYVSYGIMLGVGAIGAALLMLSVNRRRGLTKADCPVARDLTQE